MLHEVQVACSISSAVFAIVAAAAWFRAAAAPLPFIKFPDPSEWQATSEALDAYKGFQHGARWNRWAAGLTGVSALFAAVAEMLAI